MNEQQSTKTSRGKKFISSIIGIIGSNTAKAAALSRADNPSLEYQSWDILNRFVDLTNPQERLIFSLIAAAAAKGKMKEDGTLGIGAALANCYEGKSENDQAVAKVRRLIACDSIEELCSVLRPLLQLVLSKNGVVLNYGRLLDELLQFQWNPSQIKARWAKNFYDQNLCEEEEHVC